MLQLRRCLIASSALLVLCGSLWAEVKVASVFCDNMVLQRDLPIKVWGTADAGEKITVTLSKLSAAATADDKGQWQVKLDALPASTEPAEMTVAGKNTIKLANVLIGDVWVCSGQSNMEMAMTGTLNAANDIKAAEFPQIRLFTVARQNTTQSATGVGGRWAACTPATVGNFSAVGYFFGRKLHQDLKVPIGLIASSWGGTKVELWTPIWGYESEPLLQPFKGEYQKEVDAYPKAMDNYHKAMIDWEARSKAAATQPVAGTNPATIRAAGPQRPGQPGSPDAKFSAACTTA